MLTGVYQVKGDILMGFRKLDRLMAACQPQSRRSEFIIIIIIIITQPRVARVDSEIEIIIYKSHDTISNQYLSVPETKESSL